MMRARSLACMCPLRCVSSQITSWPCRCDSIYPAPSWQLIKRSKSPLWPIFLTSLAEPPAKFTKKIALYALGIQTAALDSRHPPPSPPQKKNIMPRFLKLCGFTGNFWKAVATIEGLKVDSRATAHSHSFLLAYSHAAAPPRAGIWLLAFDWFYSPRHATLGLCICRDSCIPLDGIWFTPRRLVSEPTRFLRPNELVNGQITRMWEGRLVILRNFTATFLAAGQFRCTRCSQTWRPFDWWR